jgi:hypothetical protein
MPFIFRIIPVLVLFLGGQLYFAFLVSRWLRRKVQNRSKRMGIGLAVLGAYVALFLLYIATNRQPTPSHMTLRDALTAPFAVWIYSSPVAFLFVIVIWMVRLIARGVKQGHALLTRRELRDAPAFPARRQFLERTAGAVVAAPFVAGTYALLWGRLNLQIVPQPVRLNRLPRGFHGFRIAQLSDIHIGPFMSEDEIRKYVRIANEQKPDLIVLTGDFLTWDTAPELAVVNALSGLKAPFGVWGCLGNHDSWAMAEDSLSELFAQCGVRMLRQERVAIRTGGDSFNLMGIDFANSRRMSAGPGHLTSKRLEGIEKLMSADTANILLSHNPETFDRAAELGIDLSLAGHTHGGQLALEFISPEIAPSRLVTPYVAGLFQQPGGQLYVNRGIGTIAAPMRLGAPPEITVFELQRG